MTFAARCAMLRAVASARKKVEPALLAEIVSETPVGRVHIVASERGVREILFAPRVPAARNGSPLARRHAATAAKQLHEYFSGKRKKFDFPLDLQGTEHQKRVWRGLLEIPFGRTLSYGELARRVGLPKAPRAVGAACGANPVCVVVPCHRVIGSDGGLHGYGGGLWRKQALLELEGAEAARRLTRQRALPFPGKC